MVLGRVLRNLFRPLSASHVPRISTLLHREPCAFHAVPSTSRVHTASSVSKYGRSFSGCYFSTWAAEADCSSLTDARLPKRRPATVPRRKRASLKPPGPYAWVQYVPNEPIPRSRPSEGSVGGRNEKKRIKQRKAFILCERKNRKAQETEARKKRDVKRIERKMAAVAREKAWAQRLVQLQPLHKCPPLNFVEHDNLCMRRSIWCNKFVIRMNFLIAFLKIANRCLDLLS